MNNDYTYCFGFNIFALANLCKNCNRNIPFSVPIPNAIWWTTAHYNPDTGKCLLYEPKTNNN